MRVRVRGVCSSKMASCGVRHSNTRLPRRLVRFCSSKLRGAYSDNHKLRAGRIELHLVGVNHASRQSVDEVRGAIQNLAPDVVAVELDRERAKMLLQPSIRGDSIEPSTEYSSPTTAWEMYFVEKFEPLWSHKFLAKGQELVCAITEAQSYNSQIWLIDRPNWVSAQRFEANREAAIQADEDIPVKQMKNRWREVYVDERDEWMVGQLRARVALCTEEDDISCIVCVVGRDHLHGIAAIWNSGVVVDDDRMGQLMHTVEGYQLPQHNQEHKNKMMIRRHAVIGLAISGFFLTGMLPFLGIPMPLF